MEQSMLSPWNKGRLIGQKPALKPKEIWAIRFQLRSTQSVRDLAMFNLALDSKLRAIDLVALRIRDVANGLSILSRAMIIQRKTKKPVKFEITEDTRESLKSWLNMRGGFADDFVFPSCRLKSWHLSTRQYARLLHRWIDSIGLDSTLYGTHSMRRTKASLIYKRTRNLRAVQLLLGHSKLESTVRYLGIDEDDALEISERMEI